MEKGVEMVGIAIERGRHVFDGVRQNARGEAIPVEVTIIPVMLNDEPHLMGIWHDLTERKQMEQKIIAEGERLKTILDTAPISIAFSTKGKIHFANPLFIETFGAKPGDASPQLYVNPEERDTLVERLKRDGIRKNLEIQMFNATSRYGIVSHLSAYQLRGRGWCSWLAEGHHRAQAGGKRTEGADGRAGAVQPPDHQPRGKDDSAQGGNQYPSGASGQGEKV